jgi:hypothetical protein
MEYSCDIWRRERYVESLSCARFFWCVESLFLPHFSKRRFKRRGFVNLWEFHKNEVRGKRREVLQKTFLRFP